MKKRISAFIISLTLAAACFAGCGDSDSSSSKKESSKADTSTSADSQTGKDDSEDDTSDEDDSKPLSEEQLKALEREKFFTDLDAQYQEYGTFDSYNAQKMDTQIASKIGTMKSLTGGYGFISGWNDKDQYYAYLFNEDGTVVDLLDPGKGLSEEIKHNDNTTALRLKGDFYYYGGGYLYELSCKSKESYYVYEIDQVDMKGNVTNTVVFDPAKMSSWGITSKTGSKDITFISVNEIFDANRNGDVIVPVLVGFKTKDGDQEEEKMLLLVSKGSDKAVKIPALTEDVGHGETEDTDVEKIERVSSYKNKFYVTANDKSYYLDTNDVSWHELSETAVGKITVGRYLFDCIYHKEGDVYNTGNIYDMETDKIIGKTPIEREIFSYYHGGDSVVVPLCLGRKDKKFQYKIIELSLPYDDEEVEASTDTIDWYNDKYNPALNGYKTLKEFSEKVSELYDHDRTTFLSKTHFAFGDDYGVFIQSFENGEADEKTVIKFSK